MRELSEDRRTVLARWASAAEQLTWAQPPRAVAEGEEGRVDWFPGGTLNLAVNAVHRHVPTHADRIALHWEGEPGDRRDVTYGELDREVTALADALVASGLVTGDRVALHVGLVPEAVVALLACFRIGAVPAIVPAVLPADALTDRLADLRPRVLVTQDGAWRHGVVLPLKSRADEALTGTGTVEQTIVIRRTGIPVPWFDGDRWYDELIASPRPGSSAGSRSSPVAVASDHPSLITHLPNRAGVPVGVVHGSAGLATVVGEIHRSITGSPTDVVWVPAELAWLASQSHGILGPLLNAGTTVVFEGMLDTPSHRRAWEIIARYAVRTVLVTPSVIRALRSWVGNGPTPDQVGSLRRIVTAGEAMDEDTERWLTSTVGHDRAAVVNAWGQTELGGAIAFPATDDGPAPPDPGLRVEAPDGTRVAVGEVGDLVLRHPWPATALGVLRGESIDDTFPLFRNGALVTGDRARVAADGELELLGRSDRVFTVAGQLVSADAIALALTDHPFVARAMVVDRPDSTTGRAVVAVVQACDRPADEELARELQEHVRELLGGLSQPRSVVFLDRFPDAEDPRLLPALRRLASPSHVVAHLHVRQVTAAMASVADPELDT
ncbi:MAG: hypothetical protein EA387_02955 [Nitriliruptor sp.]|nr:MAG: hypothetical protein EA387_02955 [Nitriliruptor sp.]